MRKDTKLDKFFRWITDVEFRFKKAKNEWRSRSAFSKIIQLVLILGLMIVAWAILYFAIGLFSKTSSNGIAEIVKSLLLFLVIFLLILIDLPIIAFNYKDLIITAIVAFTCRPPKKVKNKMQVENTEGAEQVATSQQNENVAEVSKTSRGFDTVIGIISVFQVVLFTAGLVFAALLALKVVGKKID